MKRIIFFIILSSCSNMKVDRSLDRNLTFTTFKNNYCSTHFCFYSNEDLPLVDISNMAQNIFYYLSLNYSFNTLDEYPYNVVVYSTSNAKDFTKECKLLYYSTSQPCAVSSGIIAFLLNDIFEGHEGNCVWLYYGFLEYVSSQFCTQKAVEYSNILLKVENNISLEALFYLDPKKLSSSNKVIYYANVYKIVKFLIENYSYYKFSIFVNELIKTGDLKNSSLTAFGEDIIFVLKNRFR